MGDIPVACEEMHQDKYNWLLKLFLKEPPQDLSVGFVTKSILCLLGFIGSSLVLLNSYFNLILMARFPMPEKVLGRMAHEFSTQAMRDSMLAALSASILTICASWLGSEFIRRRRPRKSAELR
jgi:hypothetical protein